MTTRIVISAFVFVVCLGCSKQEVSGLTNDEIIEILADIHVAEGLINSHHPLRMKDTLMDIYRTQVFEHHKITDGQFEQALGRIHDDPVALEHVYTSVKKVLQERSSTVDKNFDGNATQKKDNDGLF